MNPLGRRPDLSGRPSPEAVGPRAESRSAPLGILSFDLHRANMSPSKGFILKGARDATGTSTVLPGSDTNGLGSIRIEHPKGTFALTPASFISLTAICYRQDLLSGVGLDWGTGTGCLAIAAARVDSVRRVYGLEVERANVNAARVNVTLNAVDKKVRILHCDSYRPFTASGVKRLEALKHKVTFILANPPSSEGDDGFGYRREVLRGGRKYLERGGRVFLSISSQYGAARITRLVRDAPGFVYRGLLASTNLVPFDLSRSDLLHCLELYAAEERRGGLEYTFHNPEAKDLTMNATSGLDMYRSTGRSPLMRWQTHLFEAR